MVISNDVRQSGSSTEQWLNLLRQQRAIAVIRCLDFKLAYQMALAAAAGGMKLIEITWNSAYPDRLIQQLRSELPHCVIGTGTILTAQDLRLAVVSGAQFAFAPHLDSSLLQASLRHYQIPLIPGIFSPSEAVKAWQSGAKAVKVFPIKSLGGAEYIKCLQGPLGQIPLIPTGGITLENAPQMLQAGAIAVGISSSLFTPSDLANHDWQSISARAHLLREELQSVETKSS